MVWEAVRAEDRNAFLPDAAAVQKQRRPTGTLYQPPPEMDQESKKARV